MEIGKAEPARRAAEIVEAGCGKNRRLGLFNRQ